MKLIKFKKGDIKMISKKLMMVLLVIPCLIISNAFAQKKEFISSPVYHVDISLNYTGKCSQWGDGASFIQYSAISQFNSIRFVPSLSEQHPCWIGDETGTMSNIQVSGEGRIVSIKICPDYDGEERPARITRGPLPFQPTLQVITVDEGLEYYFELTGNEPEVLPIVPSVWFKYSDSFRLTNAELEWQTDIGGYPIGSHIFVFHVPLESLGKGERIHTTVPYKTRGETGTWDITFDTK